ncbi:IclR family transcriptional regulator [Novosphingobium album (ex Liu et al. 2023)]|uniref:IclR family transcriptional regulator n=1 Tax=Novosphingobium album (ex Liu et al. 2023) TaxID=3031130 RepID=A0ABT5WVG6_9SPHN|nr:IclR family transcriptional regulator [Novosphingobium album (ex Liu et al. 2023)]MDE8653911.1 IclR family transcriptional regulator [Novosphingobium album (ex Liu et al. 2023)]
MSEVGENSRDGEWLTAGPRAILRVPEVLMAVASELEGCSFTELRDRLELPKSSLHRLLRTLEHGGYLHQKSGCYVLGPQAEQLARKLSQALPTEDLPATSRPTIEWLARETGESVMLGVPTRDGNEIFYVEVINSATPLRFTVPLGHKRPLYAAASGQVVLAHRSREELTRYLAETEFQQLTRETLSREQLLAQLARVRERGVVLDRNGSFMGASAVASPCCDKNGDVKSAISIAGPTERIEQALDHLFRLSLEAGEKISRLLGYTGPYPPRV